MTKKLYFSIILLSLALFFPILNPSGVPAADNALRVLDISERTYDNSPAIAIIFSQPLDPAKRYDEYLRISDDQNLLKSAWVMSEDNRTLYFLHIEPETVYSVSVLEGLTSASGEMLGKRFFKAITTRKITAGVNFASDGLILPENLSEGLPVAVMNVKTVEVEFFRLDDSGVRNFVNWRNITGRRDYGEIEEAKNHGEFVYSGRFNLDPPKNKRIIRHIPVMDIEEIKKPGIYFAVMRQPGEYRYDYQATYFLVTDIGLHARVYKKEALFFASSLKTGAPLSGVELHFYNRKIKKIFSGVTDENGRMLYNESLSGQKVAFIKATLNGHVSILPLEIPALDLSDFDVYGRRQAPREAFVYSPRDLYRPGETVVVSALLRDYDGRPTLSLPLNARLYRPDGRKVRSFTWRPENPEKAGTGYYQTKLNLSGDAQTGRWRLELRDNPSSNYPFRVFSFSVEDFMPERMKLELKSDQEFLKPGLDFSVKVSGLYLYGAPAAGNRLDGRVSVRAERRPVESLPEFMFGDIQDRNYSDYWEIDEVELDQTGLIDLEIENKWDDVNSPLAIFAWTSLYESGGRPVSRGIKRIYWPSEAMVGIRPLFKGDSVDEGAVKFEVVKAGPGGALVPTKGLMITVTKEDRDYYWEYSESRGWQHKFTEKRYVYQTDNIDVDGVKPALYSLPLQRGRYLISVRDPETNLLTSFRFYVGGWYWDGDSREASRPDKVQLAFDRPSYQPGDVIRLKAIPPHSGEARILVESSKPLWFKNVHLPAEGGIVEIPVSAAWDSHDIYVSAVVFRPGDVKEKITPNRAMGVAHIPMDRTNRKLSLSIEAPEKVRPQGPAPMTAKIKLDGKPEGTVFVTLAAVDVGILNITDFKTPDPLGWFFAKRRYSADSYDLYGKVVELMAGDMARLQCGGDAAPTAGGKRPETKVKLVSLFQAPVAFNEEGEAEVTMTVPADFNGKLRLMAVAFSHNSFGSAESEVTVAAPMVTQMAMPRYLSPGDKSELSLDVHNMSDIDQELKIKVSATYPLVLENGELSLSLKDQEKTTLKFPVKAEADFMPSIITMELTGEGVTLNREWQLGIRPGYPGIARKVRKILQPGEEFTLDKYMAADMMPSSVDAAVKISPVIPLNLRKAMKDLIDYPHGCLEQTTSRAYPLLYATPDNIDKLRLPFINQEERIKRLEKAIERISMMQKSKGGFGLWNERSPEEQWLTAYAVDFLVQARDAGLKTPGGTLDKAFKRLEYYLQRKWPSKADSYVAEHDFTIRSYAAYVLAKVGRAPLGTLRTLHDNHREAAKSSLSLTHLGLALKLMGDGTRSRQAIDEAVKLRRTGRHYWGDYGSPIRDLAMTAALLISHNEEAAGLESIIVDLDDGLRQRRWFSTQEKYALFSLGMALETITNKEWGGVLKAGGQETILRQKAPYIMVPKVDQITEGIAFRSDSQRPVYLSAVVGGYTKSPPEMDDSLILLERELYDMKGALVKGTEFNVGDLYLVHILVNSKKSMPDALLVDLLPAGFEIENPNFKYSVKIEDSEVEETKIEGKPIWRLRNRNRILHEEYRDDRYVAAMRVSRNKDYHLFYLVRVVSPGEFNVPPLFMESMYRPEIRGIGETPPPVRVINRR